jgi:hypothetical protein
MNGYTKCCDRTVFELSGRLWRRFPLDSSSPEPGLHEHASYHSLAGRELRLYDGGDGPFRRNGDFLVGYGAGGRDADRQHDQLGADRGRIAGLKQLHSEGHKLFRRQRNPVVDRHSHRHCDSQLGRYRLDARRSSADPRSPRRYSVGSCSPAGRIARASVRHVGFARRLQHSSGSWRVLLAGPGGAAWLCANCFLDQHQHLRSGPGYRGFAAGYHLASNHHL